MEHIITVVGIGPGSPDYLLPVAYRTIKNATVLVGSKRALDAFATDTVNKKVIDGDIEGVIAFIKDHLLTDDVVVMVSGDPGFYSMLGALKARFLKSQITVIPGISSAQLAYARIGEVWQDSLLTSLHGREQHSDSLKYEVNKKLGILTDGVNNPQRIAQRLIALGWPEDSHVWLCEYLSYENERIIPTTLKETTSIDGFSHCVMVVTA
ncbi:Cobalamin biosynthesis bifunctional protein CbiET [bioreactor metagenome]|uniref:Cobalamin biosynthesis bifunctional protein CbiET n=1 Tax=bioreactor metagenome TaxID=1076179 RepID=A0A644T0Z7_9ZZZZ|nr:precorrin-6y C5,15-methyltransferase (decarboxylating) subunit CbiE [Negativicutes bacterium]